MLYVATGRYVFVSIALLGHWRRGAYHFFVTFRLVSTFGLPLQRPR